MLGNERLFHGLLRLIETECDVNNKQRLQTKLSELLSGFNVKVYENYTEDTQEMAEKIEMFIQTKKLEGSSEHTVKGYKRELNNFANRIRKTTEQITANDVRTYLNDFCYLKKSSISTKLSILKSFFGWLIIEELINKNPTAKINPIKTDKQMPKSLTIEELELLREICITERERAILEVLYATGCRLAEITALNITDINYNNYTAKVTGKGGKEREIYFSFKAMYHLRKYLNTRQDNNRALFVGMRRPYERLNNRSIQKEITNIANRAGIVKDVTPHVLRHTFATLTLNNGAELSVIQSLLGHTSPATTQVYAQVTDEYKFTQYRKYLIQ